MIQLVSFFLLQPGESKGTKSPTTHFQIKDVSLRCGAANFDTLKTPAAALKTATYGKLDFTTQKNNMWEEAVVHGNYGNALLFPKSAPVRHILYLREQGSAPYKNLSTFNRGGC